MKEYSNNNKKNNEIYVAVIVQCTYSEYDTLLHVMCSASAYDMCIHV